MAIYSIFGFPPGAFQTVSGSGIRGGEFRLDPSFDVDTDAYTFTVTDDDTGFQGDLNNNESGDDTSQQTSVIKDASGTTTGSGQTYLENRYSFTDEFGSTVNVYEVEIGGVHHGWIADGPIQPGNTYTISSSANVTDTDHPLYSEFVDTTYDPDDANSITGTSNADSLEAGSSADTVSAGDGNDTIEGNGGADSIDGGDGDDSIEGGSGNDTIDGEDGNDSIYGDDGNDSLRGWDGDDYIEGGDGNDTLEGDGGTDTLLGGAGDDLISLWTGADSVDGGDGQDTIRLYDSFGNDTITGGEGGTDNDNIDLTALTGPVTVTYSGDEAGTITNGTDTITFSEIENIFLTAFDDSVDGGADSSGMNIFADDGEDTVTGGSGDDSIEGGGDDDTIFGGDGADTLRGGDGNDSIGSFSGTDNGDDLIYGDAGNDNIISGWGNDTVYGGTGNDTLIGHAGTDYLYGGDDEDQFWITDDHETVHVWGGEGGSDNDQLWFSNFTTTQGVEVTFSNTGAGSFNFLGTVGTGTFAELEGLGGTSYADTIDLSADTGGMSIWGGGGEDTVTGGSSADTIDGGADDDRIDAGLGDDAITGGTGDDTLIYDVGDGYDTISDFNTGNTGTLSDGDGTNNDFINLSGFYDNLSELYADQADDGILNQSNATDTKGRTVDYSDNDEFGAGSITFTGASADNTSFTQENVGVVCFTSGTAIRTPHGDVLIDDLNVGDLVTTMDNGPQRIRWIGMRNLNCAELAAAPNLRPILIQKGILGVERDLLVSPQHGMLIGNDLARAKHLVAGNRGIRVANGQHNVSYIHLMFDAHQIVFTENAPSESFYPGPMALSAKGELATEELFELMPDLRGVQNHRNAQRIYGTTVRPFAKRRSVEGRQVSRQR